MGKIKSTPCNFEMCIRDSPLPLRFPDWPRHALGQPDRVALLLYPGSVPSTEAGSRHLLPCLLYTSFYVTPGLGKNEVRLAYVINKEDLNSALNVLEKALEAYPYTLEYECGAVHSKAYL